LPCATRREGRAFGLFLGTGVLGGFTTFSAFSLDAVLLWERGAWAAALGYVIVSVALSIAALLAGLSLSREFA
jgi:CrcB protein